MGDVDLSRRYIAGVIRLRWLVIAAWSVAIAAAGWLYLAHFRIDNSVAIWFLEDDPELVDYRRSMETFGETEWSYLWLRTEGVFEPEFLRGLQELAAQIGELEHVQRTVAITDARGIREGESGRQRAVDFYPLEPGALATAEQAASLRADLDRSALFGEALLARDDERFTVVAIQNDNLISEAEPYRIELLDRVRELVGRCPGVLDSGIVGTTVVNAELNRAARRDMFVYYALIATFVLVVGASVLRSWRDLAVLVAVLAATVLPVMGGAAALGLSFNLMTIMLPTLLVTVGVSYLIHFLNEFHLVRTAGVGIEEALAETLARLLRPGFWTSATTIIGFVSLTASEVVPIRQLGWLAALGILLAWLATLTIAPALVSLLWSSDAARGAGSARPGSRRMDAVLLGLVRRRTWVAIAFAAAVIVAALALPRLRADTDYVKFFKPGSAVRGDYQQLAELGLPQSSLEVNVTLPEGARFADLAMHRRFVAFENALAEIPEVARVDGLNRIVRLMHEEFGGGGEADSGQLAVLLMLAESGVMPEADDFIATDGETIRLRVFSDYLSTDALNRLRGDIERVIAESLPAELEAAPTGTNILWANMDGQVIRTQITSITITSAALLLILPLVFRSLLLGMLGFVVSFVPIVCTLGIMAWSGVPVNIATCILGGVVIGLSVDDTIYFLSRIRRALEDGCGIDDALRQATLSTGRAMVKTSAVLIGGFLTMTASDFLPSVYFGLFFSAGIVIALLADLLLLPALLRVAWRARCAG